MSRRIDINVDVGEGFEWDAELMIYATSANICCGAHAGSFDLTRETIGMALDHGLRIGMHPGYPDRANMGRAAMPIERLAEYSNSIGRQIEEFFNFVPAAYIKPHGAFYNEAISKEHPSYQILAANAKRFRLPVMGLPGTAHESIGQKFIREGFADRATRPDGTLVPRSEPGAVLQSVPDILDQVIRLAETVDTICIHGDTPGCVDIAEAVHDRLLGAGYEVGC